MPKRLSLIVVLSLFLLIPNVKGQVFDFKLVNFEESGPTLNNVYFEPNTNIFYAVGDCGWIYTIDGNGNVLYSYYIDPEYNLTGISGVYAGNEYLCVVGYKSENTPNGPKWKGAIWTALNPTGPNSWNRVWDVNLPRDLPHDVPIPFLDVTYQALGDPIHIWVSCGYGFVMKSTDYGATWSLTTKPVHPNYAGWLWGICCDGSNIWVCSDESTLVAHTDIFAQAWTVYTPYFDDSLSYRDAARGPAGTFYFASSKGYIVYTTDNGSPESWHKYKPVPMETNEEWLTGVFNYKTGTDLFLWTVGSGGIIAKDNPSNPNPYNALLWYSKKYDFKAIDGFAMINPGVHTYLAVGTNKTIMWIKMDNTPPQREPKIHNSKQGMWVSDRENDEGWSVKVSWDPYPDAQDYYKLYIVPANDTNNDLIRNEEFGKLIDSVDLNITTFQFDSILPSQLTTYTLTTNIDDEEEAIYVIEDLSSAFDNSRPRQTITNLQGYYSNNLDAAVLNWDPIPTINESNPGGYWVCPVIDQDEHINHWSPILRNYYIESVPAGIQRPFRWGFKVQAMDRSGKRGDFQSNYYFVTIPSINLPPTNTPYATAFNQGRHLVRFNETNLLHIVYEDTDKIYYAYSADSGEHWTTEELGDGYFPSIGVDHNGCPWIAYWKEGDIVCKVKKSDGSWKERIVYDCNDTCWAGPPAIAMGTVPSGQRPLLTSLIRYM